MNREPIYNDWINHDGGKCPVAGDVMVEVELADGSTRGSALARKLAWGGSYRDEKIIKYQKIIKYRVVNDKPASNKPSWDDAPANAKILVGHIDGPWFWGTFEDANIPKNHDGWVGVGKGYWISCHIDGPWFLGTFEDGKGYWISSLKCTPNPNWRETLEFRPVIDTNINHVTTTNLSEELEEMAGKLPQGSEWIKPPVSNKYNKPCKGITIDVYDVLKAFEVTCPAMQHAIKKCLMAGKRGSKDAVQDMNEAIQSIERSKELLG